MKFVDAFRKITGSGDDEDDERDYSIDGEDEDDGTGMGMWIVNRTISEYNGVIDLSENQRTETGFYAKIILGGRNV